MCVLPPAPRPPRARPALALRSPRARSPRCRPPPRRSRAPGTFIEDQWVDGGMACVSIRSHTVTDLEELVGWVAVDVRYTPLHGRRAARPSMLALATVLVHPLQHCCPTTGGAMILNTITCTQDECWTGSLYSLGFPSVGGLANPEEYTCMCTPLPVSLLAAQCCQHRAAEPSSLPLRARPHLRRNARSLACPPLARRCPLLPTLPAAGYTRRGQE